MSKEQIKRFGTDIKDKKELQEEVIKEGTDPESLIAVAQRNGYDFTLEELKAAIEEAKSKLTDEELNKISAASSVADNALEYLGYAVASEAAVQVTCMALTSVSL